MKRLTLDKIASVTTRLGLDANAVVGEGIPAEAGAVVACRVLSAKSDYDKLEDVHGRLVRLMPGDVIAGALGHRDALRGFSGHVPTSVAPGDELQLLNLGGVIGTGAVRAPGVGEPFLLEALGSVLRFPHLDRRAGVPARIGDAALATPPATLGSVVDGPLVVALVGTSMDAGKTTAATRLIADLTHRGLTVAAGKLTGVSARRDVLDMADSGAKRTAIFTDFGVVTTSEATASDVARRILAHLTAAGQPDLPGLAPPDVVVLELGDGLLGTYGVHAILADPVVRASLGVTVLCAHDPVGAWGATELLRTRYDITPDVVAGPVTDTPAGTGFLTSKLGLASWNALRDASPDLPALAALGKAAEIDAAPYAEATA